MASMSKVHSTTGKVRFKKASGGAVNAINNFVDSSNPNKSSGTSRTFDVKNYNQNIENQKIRDQIRLNSADSSQNTPQMYLNGQATGIQPTSSASSTLATEPFAPLRLQNQNIANISSDLPQSINNANLKYGSGALYPDEKSLQPVSNEPNKIMEFLKNAPTKYGVQNSSDTKYSLENSGIFLFSKAGAKGIKTIANKVKGKTPSMPNSQPGVLTEKFYTNPNGMNYNVGTQVATDSYISKMVATYKDPVTAAKLLAYLVGSSLGGYVFGEWQKNEAADSYSFGKTYAQQIGDATGDYSLLNTMVETEREMLTDDNLWESMRKWIPVYGAIEGIKENLLAKYLTSQAKNKVLELESELRNSGDSSNSAFYSLTFQKELEEKKLIEEQRIKLTEQAQARRDEVEKRNREEQMKWERDFNLNTALSKDSALFEQRKQQMEEEAAFWANKRAEAAREEMRQIIAQAEYWKQVREEKERQNSYSEPSKLSFGLI